MSSKNVKFSFFTETYLMSQIPTNGTTRTEWTTQDSEKLYHISRWGKGYFNINEQGQIQVLPNRDPKGPRINLKEVIEEADAQKVSLPAVFRFHDILRSQVIALNETFKKIIEEAKFQGRYYGVYPIKVNQMREVVEEIVDAGAPYDHGLEAGSKPELLAALAMNTNPESLTILNGYKDENFLRLALLGRLLGRKIIIVVEKFSELPQIVQLAKEMNVTPMIGIRAKLSTKGSGKWAGSSGDHAKFGLTIPEILNAVKYLKDQNLEHYIKLFHFHIGSQITDIRTIKDAITEGARIYAKLVKMDIPIEYFDAGGGLGVDYVGAKSETNSSINYNMEDYVGDVVYILKKVCELEGVNHPNIVTETGRAIVAHHSCVIVPVFGKIELTNENADLEVDSSHHLLVKNIRDLLTDLNPQNYLETYHDGLQIKDEAISAFKLGILNLEERAKIENIFWKICKLIQVISKQDEFAPDEMKTLDQKLSDQYLCNFSVFQSTIDYWSINQLLPIVPIERLNEKPSRQCTLADITCDSDGKIDNFIGLNQPRKTLPVHDLKENEKYYLSIFLTGAYQDIMGDMHNLFGRVNEVHVFCDDDDPLDFYVEEVIDGNTSAQVLSTLQYLPTSLAITVKREIDKRVAQGFIRPREGVKLIDFFEECLRGQTYLKH